MFNLDRIALGILIGITLVTHLNLKQMEKDIMDVQYRLKVIDFNTDPEEKQKQKEREQQARTRDAVYFH